MSKRRVYKQTTIDIMTRFFEALERCRELKLVESLTEYCTKIGAEKAHFYTQRKDLYKGFFEVGWMVPLINECGVSAHWLMTGKGTMFME